MPGLEPEFDAVVAALGAAALIGDLDKAAIGQVPARTHRGGDGLDIAAGFGVDESREPRHPVGSLRPQGQAAAPGPVGFVVIAVGVEDLINTACDCLDDLGIVFGSFPDEAGFDVAAVGHRHARGQSVDGPADHPQMVLADRAGFHSVGHQFQLGASGGPHSWRRGRMRAAVSCGV